MRELWQKIALTSGAQAYSLAVGIVILTITARWLGPDGRGTIAAVTTWVAMFSTVGCLSLGQVAIFRATQLRSEGWLGPTLGSLLSVGAVVTLGGWSMAVALYLVTSGDVFHHLPAPLLAIGFVGLPFMIWEQYGSALLMAVDRVAIYNRAQLLGRTTGLVLVVLAWLLKGGVAAVLAVAVVSEVIVALTGLRLLSERAGGRIRPNRGTVRELIRGGARLHLNYIGGFVISSSSIVVINYFAGSTATGFYQLALQLISVFALVPQAAAMVFYGKLTECGPDGTWRQQRRVVLLLMIGVLAVGGVAGLLAPWAIPLVMGDGFAPAAGLFQIMLIGLIGMALATAMSPQWIGRGLFGYMSGLTVVLGLLNLGANVVLVPRIGAWGAAWSLVGTYLLAAFVQLGMIVHCEARLRQAVVVAEWSRPGGGV